MRKLGLCAMLVLMFGSLLGQQGFRAGAFALPQAVWMLNADDQDQPVEVYDQQWLAGMSGGVSLGYVHPLNIGLQLNIIYAQQGNRYTRLNAANEEVTEVSRLEYVKIPLMVGYQYETVKATFSAYAGVQTNVLTRAWRYNDNEEFENPLEELVLDAPTAYQSYETVDFNYVADLGMDVKLDYNLMFNLRLRGEYSINDAENKDAFVRTLDEGEIVTVPYWEFVRAGSPRAVTKNLAAGILIGITYLFGQE